MLATSRYRFCTREIDEAGRTYLGPRPVFGFRELTDTREHVVNEGDTLHALAAAYFRGMPRPEQFYWVIGDFQPEPIRDATLRIDRDRLYIPSRRVLEEQILSARRESTDEEDLGA